MPEAEILAKTSLPTRHMFNLRNSNLLQVVSVLGLLVNLIGIFAFRGAHGHSHGGGHDHSHGSQSQGQSHGGHGHSHEEHSHGHNTNMEGMCYCV